jgi:hypothetical protein
LDAVASRLALSGAIHDAWWMLSRLSKSIFFFTLLTTSLLGQASSNDKERWSALSFLEGTWEARTLSGAAKADVVGTYSFKKELGGHILARHSSADGCKGPADFDCDHGDLLYIYQDSAGQPLKAIYFDNEGHVIHYGVDAPTPSNVVFLSEPAPGPRFRLVYELKAGLMSGKFQMQMPGKTEWTSYLEWSGKKK